ncbi:MAG TPA: NAD(P)/FAD-dependent oxidoreductase [Clostridia bacterium]|nr:NAD(P)/FAD-dependent oxidoreductase [Clostridia bacterium]
MTDKKICIIGNGAAAIEAVKALRENKYMGQIHLFSDSIWPSYNPMLTTYYAAGKIDFSGMFPFGYGMDLYKEYDVKLHLGSPVVELDTNNRVVKNDAGEKFEYDKCLIATGARPFVPPIKGVDNKKVLLVRTVEDALKLREEVKKSPERVLVVGASMVGIKVVEMLNDIGVKVCLADLASSIFPLAAHKECANIIQEKLVEKGVELRLGASLTGIEETPNGLKGYFGESDSIEADFIVLCIGVRPNLSFVDKNQITIDRGIVVDDHMRTNDENVYAAGDVSQGTNLLTGKKQIIGLWTNARYQGRTAGRNMAGVEDVFKGNTLHNITHFMDMVFAGIGDLYGGERHETVEECDSYVQLVWNEEKLVGVNTIGKSSSNIGIIKNALEKSLIEDNHLDSKCLCSTNLRDSLLMKNFVKHKI